MVTFLFPQGKKKVLTFSYDDGPAGDRRLVRIFNEHAFKGTFNLNSCNLSDDNPSDRIHASEVRSLYLDAGHEVACHGFCHPFEEQLPPQAALEDLRTDRLALEAITHRPVVGMAYPFGTTSAKVKEILRSLGIVYARAVASTHETGYAVPDFLEWRPTAHHRENILELGEAFLKNPWGLRMMYVWGHAYEFDNAGNWDIMERFADRLAGQDSVWYATNLEIWEYRRACEALVFSMNGKLVRNPSALSVWLTDGREVRELRAGETTEFA